MNRRASPLGVMLGALCVSLCACAPSRDEVFAALETVPRGGELAATARRLAEQGDEQTLRHIQDAMAARPLVAFDAGTGILAQYVEGKHGVPHDTRGFRHEVLMGTDWAAGVEDRALAEAVRKTIPRNSWSTWNMDLPPEDAVDVHLVHWRGDPVFVLEVRDADNHHGIRYEAHVGAAGLWIMIDVSSQQLGAALEMAAADVDDVPEAMPLLPSSEALPGTYRGQSPEMASGPVTLTLEADGRYAFDYTGCELPGVQESGRWHEVPWGLSFEAEQATHRGRDILNPPSGRLGSRLQSPRPMLSLATWSEFEGEWFLVPEYLLPYRRGPWTMDEHYATVCLAREEVRERLGLPTPQAVKSSASGSDG